MLKHGQTPFLQSINIFQLYQCIKFRYFRSSQLVSVLLFYLSILLRILQTWACFSHLLMFRPGIKRDLYYRHYISCTWNRKTCCLLDRFQDIWQGQGYNSIHCWSRHHCYHCYHHTVVVEPVRHCIKRHHMPADNNLTTSNLRAHHTFFYMLLEHHSNKRERFSMTFLLLAVRTLHLIRPRLLLDLRLIPCFQSRFRFVLYRWLVLAIQSSRSKNCPIRLKNYLRSAFSS